MSVPLRADSGMRSDPVPAIPVLVVSGYLGAGKTTLVNHLLRSGTGRRTLVLVNDFGAVAVADELVESREADILTLANGCVCCGMRSTLMESLLAVLDRVELPELLVVETSGVADAAAVARHAMFPGFRLESVVVVCDAETVRRRARDRLIGATVLRQLAAADLVVLNKVDLVDEAAQWELRAWLAEHAPGAVRFETTEARVPVQLLFGAVDAPTVMGLAAQPELSGHVALEWSGGPLDRAMLEVALRWLPEGVLRIKGVVVLEDDPLVRTVVQRAGSHVRLERGRDWGDAAACSRVVAVVRAGDLDNAAFGRVLDLALSRKAVDRPDGVVSDEQEADPPGSAAW